jgi:Helicase conserved C-terminal domain
MPDLSQILQRHDLSYLRIVANLWGIELNARDARAALPGLVKAMLDPQLINEVVEALPEEARRALQALVTSEGRISWANFTRTFGSVREMGPGRRDREKPYKNPSSTTEILWYRSLIGMDFLKGEGEPQQYAYIPDDLLDLLPTVEHTTPPPPGRPASPIESSVIILTNDRILDHACTLLAALRMGREITPAQASTWGIPANILEALLGCAGLLANRLPQPEPTRSFLESERSEALAFLVQRWLYTADFNELWLTPALICEGEWANDARQTRRILLDLLCQVPDGAWWSITSFSAGVHERQPDFQRPAGDYDSWFIRSSRNGEYLRGIDHWDDVEAALIRFIITGPLHWLGIFDLARTEAGPEPTAFRFSTWGGDLLHNLLPAGMAKEDAPLSVLPDGRLRLALLTPRAVRYQIARFSDWEDETSQEYRYRLTPASLDRARQQGLRLSHLLTILRRHAASPPSPALVSALEHWDASGTQVFLEDVTILRVTSPDILTALRRSPAARFLGNPLGPTSIIVQKAAVQKVMAALVELGYLTEFRIEG